jgi:hypothetical protein
MSEIFRAFGLVFVIFSDDHPPPHVHVSHADRSCKISLVDLKVIDEQRCTLTKAQLRKALRLAMENRLLLLRGWERIHG